MDTSEETDGIKELLDASSVLSSPTKTPGILVPSFPKKSHQCSRDAPERIESS